nr:protein Tob1 isoform X1 [Bactrocera oleae]XP_036224876.1 protein Tob1 isoform X1 [Bactrocera oleae]XP_036224878.1 protein Tob1 isoform X1 [Bactrocera oleae]
MHIEIQVALNFVISYLYNKLPRRRVNIFGEELEKALKDKFQGHWYPEKPFKGSAFRCLKTGDPIDSVLERAARESGVPIADILENLPAELSVWVDPGEVSYRIGEKGAVKILYSENSDNHEDNTSADREVNKTFNPEAQCFRPIDAVNTSMNNLSLSPKTSPHAGSSPHSASSNSPTYKGSPNPAAAANGSFMQRTQAPLTFTTATFAQTKFGSTKLKTSSKRTNSSSSYRMSPTEFSNYIKQRAMQQQQQQLHHGGHGGPNLAQPPNHFGPIGPVSPARSLSPNPLSLGLGQNGATVDPFYFPNMATMGMYPQFNGHRNVFDTHFHAAENNALYGGGAANPANGGHGKFNNYLDPHGFYGLGGNQHLQQAAVVAAAHQQQQQQQQSQMAPPPGVVGAPMSAQQQQQHMNGNSKHVVEKNGADNNSNGNNNSNNGITVTVSNGSSVAETTNTITNNAVNSTANATTPTAVSPSPLAAAAAAAVAASAAAAAAANSSNQQQQQQQDSNNSKLIDGLNSFYSNAAGPYQQLLVAN